MEKEKNYIRNCPKCGKEINYTLLKSFNNAIKNGTTCRNCIKMPQSLKTTLSKYWTGRKNPKRKNLPKNFKRCCQECKDDMFYVKEYSYKRAIKNNSKCNKCKMGNLKNIIKKYGAQIIPNFNPNACKIIDEYGKKYGYKFRHAMNGGEFYVENLGYWVDGYDKKNNVVIEVDERKHFDINGNLKNKDVIRQKEIENKLKCKFIRLKI